MKLRQDAFSADPQITPQENLRKFVDYCRARIDALGRDLDFDSDEWDVTTFLRKKGSNGTVSLVFDNWSCRRSQRSPPMKDPLKSFAKAYIRFQQGMRLSSSYAPQLTAFRSIEVALDEFCLGPNPWLLNADVLNRATHLIVERYATPYSVGREIERLIKFMASHRMLIQGLDWRNPIPRQCDTVRVGAEFEAIRRQKLPTPAALNALAQIHHLAADPSDRFVTSIVAILCSAPDRINEVLRLPVHCEVEERRPGEAGVAYGLSWPTSKGGQPTVKWMVQSMSDVAKDAIGTIRELTDTAREIALWYERNSSRLYIRPEFEHLRDQTWITTVEAGQLVFVDEMTQGSILQWLRKNDIPTRRRSKQYALVRYVDVERAVLRMLPRGFPWVDESIGLKYSNALCTFQRNLFHTVRSEYASAIDIVEHGDIHRRLGSMETSSIFHKHGFMEDDGGAIKVTSHQFRHYLNTLAQAGGLSQLDIAKWSGRKDVRQNSVYDHQSDRDILASVREIVPARKTSPQIVAKKIPITRADFQVTAGMLGVHTTDFGYCLHDFAMLPCQLHEDCLNCEEQVCVKGDLEREQNIRKRLSETQELLRLASNASVGGDVGANRWVVHQTKAVKRLEQLCALLDDSSLPNGTVVRLSSANAESRLNQAAAKRLERESRSRVQQAPT